jgi:NAD(P)-dependent dehydrogenase (short-subunit alcohol dehydrogenase family)
MTSARFQADFTGRVVCVSGGATGIGAATPRMSAAAGAQVVIADVDLAAAGATVAAITADGGRAPAVHCDVGAEVQVDELMAGFMAQEGRLDVVHANAGLESVQKATDASEAASFITGSAIPVDGGLMAALPSGLAPAYSG